MRLWSLSFGLANVCHLFAPVRLQSDGNSGDLLRDSLETSASGVDPIFWAAQAIFWPEEAIFRSIPIAAVEKDLHDSACGDRQADYDDEGHLYDRDTDCIDERFGARSSGNQNEELCFHHWFEVAKNPFCSGPVS